MISSSETMHIEYDFGVRKQGARADGAFEVDMKHI